MPAVSERRIAHQRHTSVGSAITGVRLSPIGGQASFVNISASGILVRINMRVLPGTAVTVVLDGSFSPSSIAARVARCLVADIDSKGVLWYHVGMAFNEPIALDTVVPGGEQPQSAVNPIVLTNRW